MFKTRLISGIVLVIIALATIICGGPVLFTTLLCVSLIGMQELYKATKVREDKFGLLEIVSYLGVAAYYFAVLFLPSQYHLLAVIFGLLLIMFVYVFTYPRYQTNQVAAAFLGIVYVGVMLSFVYQTRMLTGGAFLVWLIFLCSWGCDTCAYCVGVLIGKHKMAPVLSPKKSIEGAIGGVVGAALLGALYAWVISAHNPNSAHTPLLYAVICIVGALVSMIGDLAASAIKRQQNIKDYGTLIPGHGGILDRFDSVIFTAPIIYFLAVTLI
ncbi:MAG: phosphatidate cytidylyltransferase [Clostridia bacterium]|nr:phosphatidate cytidylyltransferase [Clostridia bacterium]NCC42946.1 phosphatidate cytidylyltransferase [Clostridia bacterium]